MGVIFFFVSQKGLRTHATYLYYTVTVLICSAAGGLSTKRGIEQRESVPDARQQHPWSRRHVHTGRAARSRHHAQPLSPLPEKQHLCEL